jgi:pyruvate kinase
MAAIGKTSSYSKMIEQLPFTGVNVFRLNMPHENHENHENHEQVFKNTDGIGYIAATHRNSCGLV